MRYKTIKFMALVILLFSIPVTNVVGHAGLLSNSSPLAESEALMSAVPDLDNGRQSILSAAVTDENEGFGILSYSDSEALQGIDEYDFDFNEIQ